jgi:hypothetical protein
MPRFALVAVAQRNACCYRERVRMAFGKRPEASPVGLMCMCLAAISLRPAATKYSARGRNMRSRETWPNQVSPYTFSWTSA